MHVFWTNEGLLVPLFFGKACNLFLKEAFDTKAEGEMIIMAKRSVKVVQYMGTSHNVKDFGGD